MNNKKGEKLFMKKNKMMRLASLLLVAVLLTTSVISGTYAKYVTTKSGSDSARVAEWGVVIEVNNASDMFNTSYNTDLDPAKKDENNADISVTVNGESNQVVAPGTAGSMTFSITGEPEVAANVSVTFGTISMITLPADSIVTETDTEGKETKNAVYNPIKWTLKRSETADGTKAVVNNLNGVNLGAIQAYFANTNTGISGNYAPNTDLAKVFGYYELSWVWEFDINDATNKMDTFLGDQMVLAENKRTAGVVLTESFDLTITVTQIN